MQIWKPKTVPDSEVDFESLPPIVQRKVSSFFLFYSLLFSYFIDCDAVLDPKPCALAVARACLALIQGSEASITLYVYIQFTSSTFPCLPDSPSYDRLQ